MAGTESEWAQDRLPDGSVRRRAERAAAAAVAADALLATATKAAQALSAAQLAAVQRAAALELAERYRVSALELVEKEESGAELARQALAAQEADAAEVLVADQDAALDVLADAEVAAAVALQALEARLAAGADVASSRLLAAEELAVARKGAASRLAEARRLADGERATASQLAASRATVFEEATRTAQAKELARLYAETAVELAGAQVVAAQDLVSAEAQAAAALVTAAHAAAEDLAGVRDEAAKELAKAEEQFRLVMDWAGVAGCTVSREGRFLRVNRSMCELLGRSESELLRRTLQEVTHPDDVGVLVTLTNEVLAGQRTSFRTLSRYLSPDGRVIWGDLSVAAVLNFDDTLAFHVAQIVDVTRRIDYDAVLSAITTHDALTGLASRPALREELHHALAAQSRSGGSVAVLMMDLDHFQILNDSQGHLAGDELLKAAAQRIESVMRAGDVAARPGADEFVLVMRDLHDPAEAFRTARRLVEAFRRPLTALGTEFFSTVSIGVAVATRAMDAESGDDLLRQADTAMHQAKAEGRDRVALYNEELRNIVSTRLAVEGELRHALERDQLAVWYQPEVDLATGAVIAVEALLRWHHPDGSVWTADRFIDVAEETGLILDIGEWVLRQACAQLAAWAATRPDRPIVVRVNKSALQIADPRLLPAVDTALADSGADPTQLCVEITETALLRQTTTASANLAGIHERGVTIAIDDFGTGYASLSYLRRYPIDVIKIDRSFVTNITTDAHDQAIAAAIIALAGTLGITVTAEGVEHSDQATCLRDMGCPGAQGWLYSKALPAIEATALLDHIYPHP